MSGSEPDSAKEADRYGGLGSPSAAQEHRTYGGCSQHDLHHARHHHRRSDYVGSSILVGQL